MRFTLGVVMLARAFAQSSLDPAALLARQEQEINRHRSYQFTEETSTTVRTQRMDMPPMNSTTVTQAVNPGKLRTEVTSSGLPGGITLVTVSDGSQTWTYMPLLNQYTHTQDGDTGGPGGEDVPDGITAAAKVTGAELLEIDGEQHDCWVLESSVKELTAPPQNTRMQDAAYKVWIDKQLGIQWKTSFSAKVQAMAAAPPVETSVTITIHSLKFDLDLPDSLFVFTPPPGAKETAELVPGMQAMRAGAAPRKPAASKEPPAVEPPAVAVAGDPQAFIPDLRPIHQVDPVRPAGAGDLQGLVHVLATIDATGAVTHTEALSGREIFRPAAIDAVNQWGFHPVLRDGHAVAAYTELTVDFLLDNQTEGTDISFDVAEEMHAQQRIAELAEKFPRSPEQVLADTEEQQRGATGVERLFALPKLARQALEAGDLVKASGYATELLETAKDFKDVDGTGTAAFNANTVLGRIALRQGSVSQAREYLLESAKMAPSEFEPLAPDFTLARELLAQGERDAVIEFLTACKGFWKSGAEQLDGMIASVRGGQTF